MNKIQVFKNKEFGEIRTVVKDNEPWFVGKDIAEALGYKNTRDAIIRHVDNEDKSEVGVEDSIGRRRKTPIINKSGVVSLVTKSSLLTQLEKEKFLTSIGIGDKIILQSRKEVEFGEQLTLFMSQLGYVVKPQYKVLEYYIDFYIPELNIAIEYDEYEHKYRVEKDKQRELKIQKEIGCKFIRVSDDLNIGTQLGQIARHIKEEM